jgi:polysaccharide biosynthesis protein PslH
MPRVLFLTHTAPVPPVSGDRVRTLNLMRQLVARGWNVSLFSLVIGTPPSAADRRTLEKLCDAVVLQPFDRSSLRHRLRLAGALVTGRAFHSRFFYEPEAARQAASLLDGNSFDALVACHQYMYPYVPPKWRSRAVLDAHNVELERIETIARSAPLTARGLVARLQRGPVRSFEADAARNVARVAAVSRTDAAYFETFADGRVELVPNGVDCENVRARTEPGPKRVLFLGSLDYSANVDAVQYLVREILPRLESADVEIVIAGSNPPTSLQKLARESSVPVSVVGFIEDTEPEFANARMLVVPLRMGGGTRLKILEALARGTPVVSTTVGCAGLELNPGEELLVADSPVDFAAAVDRLLADDDLCVRLATAGRAAVERRYDWREVAPAFDRAVSAAAGRGPGAN